MSYQAGVLSTEVVGFTFGSGTPLDFGSLSAGDEIVGALVVVTVPFDDPASILTLGLVSNPGGILSSADIDPTNPSTYGNGQSFQVVGPDALRLQVLPGSSTQGSGSVTVTVRRAP